MIDRDRPWVTAASGEGLREALMTAAVLVGLGYAFVDVTITGPAAGGFRAAAPWPQVLLVGGAVATVLRRRLPALAVGVGAACWILLDVQWLTAVTLYDLALWAPGPRRRVVWLAVAGLVSLLIRPFVPGAADLPFFDAVFWTVACGALPLAIGLWRATRLRLLESLRAQVEQAEQARAADVAAARTGERSRIAGEMHDVVAHRVSLMVLHAGALEVSAADEAVVRQAALIRETGRAALQDLRTVLGLLRAPEDIALAPPPTLERLDDLVRSSREAGTDVRLVVEGRPRALSAATEHAGYRIVQEGLTNVHKHAPGAGTTVRLRYAADLLEVSVRNGPAAGAPAAPFPGSGHGLLGLRERVEVLGGTLRSGPQPDGGFLVAAELPAANDPDTQEVA
ncbi:sensor histidine kinase [Kitasatospora sp. NPDC101176]|uniref:sensor histidine kinase n=1 Tax=Kitasatospora sp. NPDC101176 TaxID=3364099 RepID=UPI00382CFB0C